MNQLFILGAYVVAPLVRETRLVADLTMPVVGNEYDEPAYKRNPGYVTHSRERHRAPVVKVTQMPFLLRRQAQ